MALSNTVEDIENSLNSGVAEYIIESGDHVHVYTLVPDGIKCTTYTNAEYYKLEKEKIINKQFNEDLMKILKDPT